MSETARILDQIPEESIGQQFSLPQIKASVTDDRNNRFKNRRAKSPVKKRGEDENLFIYKDFDTSLTAVKGNIRKLPILDQTTAQRGQDMIRDRLLGFNVRNGSLAGLNDRSGKAPHTMIERSEALKRRKLSESHAALRNKPKLSNNMRQKAFWVQNQFQSEMSLPLITRQSKNNVTNKSMNVSARGLREVEEQKRMHES